MNNKNTTYYQRHKEEMKRKSRERWAKASSETKNKLRKYNREYHRNHYKEAVIALGGKCARCGFDDPRALQIDHINGGGMQERKQMTEYKKLNLILDNIPAAKTKYQILCANCNWIKRAENGETRPHD